MTTNGNMNKQVDYDDIDSDEPQFDSQIDAEVVNINQGGAQTINAEIVEINQGGAATINAETVTLSEGGAGIINARQVVLDNAQAGVIMADQVQCEDTNVFLLVASQVNGTVNTMLTGRSAAILGAAFGASLALVVIFVSRLGRSSAS